MKVHDFRKAIICLIVLSLDIFGVGLATAEPSLFPVSQEQAQFLSRIGFQNYTNMIQQTLDTQNLNEVTSAVLKANKERYRVVDLARDLALDIYTGVQRSLDQASVRKKITRLAAHLLRPHALLSDVNLPEELKKQTDPKNYSQARESFLTALAQERFAQEFSAILESTTQTLLEAQALQNSTALTAESIQVGLAQKMGDYLRIKYEYMELQNTQYWGRALTALLVRHSRLNYQPEIESDLKYLLSQQDDRLENYISATQFIKDQNQKLQTIELKSGDFANEYSHGSEAFYITIGVKPGDANSQRLANSKKLTGSLWQVALYPTPSEEEAIVNKVHSNQPLTASEKRKYKRMKKAISVSGYSHVGIVEIKDDLESDIHMPWIWDVYPNSDFGGVRFIGPEGFAFQERFQRLGYVRYDSQKFLEYYKQTISSRGYLENVWKTFEAKFNDKKEIASDLDHETWITTKISEPDVQTLASYPSQQAETWYRSLIIPRVLNMMLRYTVSEDAVGFASGFANVKGAAYCSQVLVLAFLQGVNMDPEAVQDKWSNFILLTKKLNLDAAQYFDLSQRIISPSGFAWQAPLGANERSVILDSEHRRSKYYDTNLELLNGGTTHQQTSGFVAKTQEPAIKLNAVIDDDDL